MIGVALRLRHASLLAPFEARPHWGKLFAMRAADIARLYPRLAEFLALVERMDKRRAFRNAWFAACVDNGSRA